MNNPLAVSNEDRPVRNTALPVRVLSGLVWAFLLAVSPQAWADGTESLAPPVGRLIQPPICGDGHIDPPTETCDPPGAIVPGSTSICRDTCTYCGDGIMQGGGGEQCEPPNTPACDANCHAPEICTDLVDNDGDGLIDCLDDDCDCLPIGRDPGTIRFGPAGTNDLLAVHGSIDPPSQINPTTEVISFLLTNTSGEIFHLKIPAGKVKQIGRFRFRFYDRSAQQERLGLAQFDLRYFPKHDNYTFMLKVYGDLSRAKKADMAFQDMAIQVVIGNDPFLNQATWAKTLKGWLLRLPGE